MAGFFENVGEILSGGVGKGITDIIAKKVGDKDLAVQLDHDMQALLATQSAELSKLQLTTEQSAEEEQTKRIQADAATNNAYTQQTRPKIARYSFYLTALYVLVSVTTKALVLTRLRPFEVDWAVLMVLASPELAYMGVRSFDKWKLK